MCVKFCNEDGCFVSDFVLVKVVDIDGGYLVLFEYIWLENNKFGRREDKIVVVYFVEWGVYGCNFFVDKVFLLNLLYLLYGFIFICGGDGINDVFKMIFGSFEFL